MTDLWTYRDEIKQGRAGVADPVEELDLEGYAVAARDGDAGKVEAAGYDDGKSFLLVDTGPLVFGRKILVPGGLVRTVDTVARTIEVEVTKDQLENAPEVDEERLGDDAYRAEVGRHYETPGADAA